MLKTGLKTEKSPESRDSEEVKVVVGTGFEPVKA